MDQNVYPISRQEAIKITGGLSYPSKMPCPAWGIPVEYCQTGAKLSKIPGSVCSKCYAKRGPISWPKAKACQQIRHDKMNDPRWVDAMTALIAMECDSYFRWFDIGDLQSFEQLFKICIIAERLPHIQFWLPTREVRYVKKIKYVPSNLCIRVSATMIDGLPGNYQNTSTVQTMKKGNWGKKPNQCPAPLQDNKCGSCRMCWDRKIKNVVSRKH